jgi:hypothetical protein
LSVKPTAYPPRRLRARAFSGAGLCLALGVLCLACWGCGGGKGQAAFAPPAGAHYISGVPFYPDQSHECGPASLAAVMAFHGKKTSPREVARAVYRPDLRGSLSLDMVLYARSQGLDAHFYQGGPRDLAHWLAKDRPLVLLMDYGLGPVKKLHYLVAIGYDSRAVRVNSSLKPDQAQPWLDLLAAWRRTGFATLRVGPAGSGGGS